MPRSVSRRDRLPCYLLLFMIFAVMLVFSALSPLIADDYSYAFSWDDVSRIESLSQIIPSMAAHRQVTNGRVFAHALVQALMMGPKWVFNLLNALNALALCLLAGRYFRGLDHGKKALLLLLGALLVWICMPAFGQVFLWLDGACNYSWGMSLFLLFLWPYAAAFLSEGAEPGLLGLLCRLIVAFAAGAYSENGSPAVIFMAVCLLILASVQDRKISWRLLLPLAAAGLGFIFLMSAPAMSGRASEFSVSALAGNIKDIVLSAREELTPLYLVFVGAFVLCLLFRADKKRLLLSALFFLGGLASLAAFAFAAYFTDRHFCFTVIFTVLACLILAGELLRLGKSVFPALIAGAAAVSFLFSFALGTLDIVSMHMAYSQRRQTIAQALAAGETELSLPVMVASTKYSVPWGLDDLSEDPDVWPNNSFALYYGLDSVTGYYEEN